MNPATINGSTVRLRKQGAASDVPASVSYAGNTATLDPTADLDPSAVYNVTVAGTVTDANGIALGADDTWSFTTASLSFIDTTTADFSAGTPDANTYVSETDNGEVTLKPTEGSEFSGSSLPAGWTSGPGPHGPAAPRPSPVARFTSTAPSQGPSPPTARDARLSSEAPSIPQPNQHLGFGVDLNNSANWAIFSVRFDGIFNARTNNNGASHRNRPPGRQPQRLPAPLPDRVGHDRGPLLRGRGAGGDTHRELRRHPDAPDRQRPHCRAAASSPSTGCG